VLLVEQVLNDLRSLLAADEMSVHGSHHLGHSIARTSTSFWATNSFARREEQPEIIDTGITSADLGASNHHSGGCCSSRAFAIFADFSRTTVRAAASELSESRPVRAKLTEHATTREAQQN